MTSKFEHDAAETTVENTFFWTIEVISYKLGKPNSFKSILEIFIIQFFLDRNLSIDLEKEMQKSKERKREKIVLNAAIKVKPKENTSCNIYSSAHEVLGKKEEFRWLINALY